MGNKVIFITGANGEMGHSLIKSFNDKGINNIVALDIDTPKLSFNITKFIKGSILDENILNDIDEKYTIISIYHLAAVLSTGAEKNPILANEVNIQGTKNILKLGSSQILKYNQNLLFFFPSSIAVYNVPENNNLQINENEYCKNPTTEYGKAKLICEEMGKNFESTEKSRLDFRSIRFPGIISATSIPTGGTSDYVPEMIHAAAKKESYECFVGKNRRLPFIVMPDAIEAIFQIVKTPKKNLFKNSYNITSFNPTVKDFYKKTKEWFPEFNMTYSIDQRRQKIVDSWPNSVNCDSAKKDWGWKPSYNFDDAFSNYIIQELKNKYQ